MEPKDEESEAYEIPEQRQEHPQLNRRSKTVEQINQIKERLQRNSHALGKVSKDLRDSLKGISTQLFRSEELVN